MQKVLRIISSPRTDMSVSRKLGDAIMEKITERYPDSEMSAWDLTTQPVAHLEEEQIAAFFTAPENRSAAQALAIRSSEAAIAALQEADIIVIEAPMYNFSITSRLKAWFDQIARAGITFRYTGQGLLPEGLLKDKQAYIAITSGGVYSEGDLKQYDFIEPYLRFFLTLIGITVAGVFRAEGQAIVGPEKALEEGINSIAIV